jgi:acetyltransferase-like isoleucine patch superfamily enzyme
MAIPIFSRIRSALRLTVTGIYRTFLNHLWSMDIGEGTVISLSAKLDKTNPRGVHIGKYTSVTFGAAILTHDFVNNRLSDVWIGDNCFIGAGSIILPGVTIGNNCIVAPASVVARNVPAGSLVFGNPARIVESNLTTGHYGVRIFPNQSSLESRKTIDPQPSAHNSSQRCGGS